MHKYDLEIALCLFSANPMTPAGISILLNDEAHLPITPITDKSVEDTIYKVFKDFTNVEPIINGVGWIPLVQCEIYDTINYCEQHRSIIIPYKAMIPEIVEVNHGSWFPLVNVLNENKITAPEKDIILKTIQKR